MSEVPLYTPRQVPSANFSHKSDSNFVPDFSESVQSPDVEKTRSCASPQSAHAFSTTERNVAFSTCHLWPGVSSRVKRKKRATRVPRSRETASS